MPSFVAFALLPSCLFYPRHVRHRPDQLGHQRRTETSGRNNLFVAELASGWYVVEQEQDERLVQRNVELFLASFRENGLERARVERMLPRQLSARVLGRVERFEPFQCVCHVCRKQRIAWRVRRPVALGQDGDRQAERRLGRDGRLSPRLHDVRR